MNGRLGLLALAAQFAPRLFKIRMGTWIAIAVGLLVVFGLLVWAAVAALGWVYGQAQGLVGTAREAAAGPAQAVLEQAEQMVPAVRERLDAHLGDYVPALKGPGAPARDVSGEDLGPLLRYPGLARTAWQRQESGASVEYSGRADYDAVLRHYVDGFARLGFTQMVQSANRDAETHVYRKGNERYTVHLTRLGRDEVSVRIESSRK